MPSRKQVRRKRFGNYVSVVIGRLKKAYRKRWVKRAERKEKERG